MRLFKKWPKVMGVGVNQTDPHKYKWNAKHSKGATKSDGGLAYLLSQKWHHLWTALNVQRTGGHLAGIENQPGLKTSEKIFHLFVHFLYKNAWFFSAKKNHAFKKRKKTLSLCGDVLIGMNSTILGGLSRIKWYWINQPGYFSPKTINKHHIYRWVFMVQAVIIPT